MKTMTKAAVSNLVFGGEQPYGRHIEHTTEHDSEGTDESLTGILNPKLAWIKKWDKLPDSLKEFEKERATKAMQANVALGEAEIRAIKADLDEKRCKILEETDSLGEALEKLDEFDQLNSGWFRDLVEDSASEPGLHKNWVTFTQGDEEVAMDEEGVLIMAKTRADEFLKEPNEHKGNAKRVKLDEKNWDHIKSMEAKRQAIEDWFIAKQNAIFNEYTLGVLSMEITLNRLKNLERVLLQKRDESFQQKALDSIEPPPANLPQMRKREHYLTAGGWVEKWQKSNPDKQFHKELGKSVCLLGKWRVMYTLFTESRKLTGPQFLWLTERNSAIIEAVVGGRKKFTEPVKPSKVPKEDPITINVAKVEREWALIEAVHMLRKLNRIKEFYQAAVENFELDLREWAHTKRVAIYEELKAHMAQHNIQAEEIEHRV